MCASLEQHDLALSLSLSQVTTLSIFTWGERELMEIYYAREYERKVTELIHAVVRNSTVLEYEYVFLRNNIALERGYL